MNKLTIKTGCVEAVFKRGRERTKGIERPPFETEHPKPTSETPLLEDELGNHLQKTQSQSDGTSSGPMKTK